MLRPACPCVGRKQTADDSNRVDFKLRICPSNDFFPFNCTSSVCGGIWILQPPRWAPLSYGLYHWSLATFQFLGRPWSVHFDAGSRPNACSDRLGLKRSSTDHVQGYRMICKFIRFVHKLGHYLTSKLADHSKNSVKFFWLRNLFCRQIDLFCWNRITWSCRHVCRPAGWQGRQLGLLRL